MPVLHSEEIPIPSFSSLPSLTEDDAELPTFDEIQCMESENDSDFEANLSSPQRFNQQKLNDLIRDLNLSNESSELLASRLNEKNLLQPDTNITFYLLETAEVLLPQKHWCIDSLRQS
ncbi:hypothetical protein RN001_006868 [Aquatica leii]|uniref:Uncharacterized protein n=1 Tax=Aquatica leii TaxID=1421715 RepID=A0AAN7Q284_9COLE|nr:hypothetical protein RN001_006868 [Aquatica leii]